MKMAPPSHLALPPLRSCARSLLRSSLRPTLRPTLRPLLQPVRLASALSMLALLAACALPAVPDSRQATAAVAQALEPAWQAPLPHDGQAVQMEQWWQRWNDPVLTRLQALAQERHPGLAQAVARIEQARASLAAAGAAEAPSVDMNNRLRRSALGVPPFGAPNTSLGSSLDASWEVDLFGIVARGKDAAVQRFRARGIDWHEARVSLSAEVANTYLGWRTCLEQVARLDEDVQALASTVQLTGLKVKAGFAAPADAALLRASLANQRNQVLAQRTECALLVKGLAMLTEQSDAQVLDLLAPAAARTATDVPAFVLTRVPAQALAQRPDLASLEHELAALAADAGVAEANRLPRLTLSGNIGWSVLRYNGVNGMETASGLAWGFGPALSLPIFDAGRRKAGAEAARARYQEVSALYRQKARQAVREVEEALLRLNAADQRYREAEGASRDFAAFFAAAQSRYQVGVGNLIELQEAHRQTIAAQLNLIQLRRERAAQWIALYKALGGGWEDKAS